MKSGTLIALAALALVFFGCGEDSTSSVPGGVTVGGMAASGGQPAAGTPAAGGADSGGAPTAGQPEAGGDAAGGTPAAAGGAASGGAPAGGAVALSDIVDTAVGNGNFTILAEALTQANLVETLKGDGPFTVFAPTDEAFAAYLEETGLTKEELLAAENLGQILTYHVVSGQVASGDLESVNVVTTVAELSAVVTSGDDGVMVNNRAKVTMADLGASNGVIHVVDKVIPPANVAELAAAHPAFSTLTTALTTFELVETVADAEAVTVFAPTNDAFTALIDGSDDIADAAALLADPKTGDVLKYHAIAASVASGDLSAAQVVSTLANYSAVVTKAEDGTVAINGDKATVSQADIRGTNGYIHVISAVLMPPTIVELAAAHPSYSTLVTALGTPAGLVDTLSGEGPFTVFAPSNDAFTALIEGNDDLADAAALLALPNLEQILTYHALGSKVLAADLQPAQVVDTVANLSAVVTSSADDGVTINGGAKVNAADIVGTNGVIHGIDTVLMPADIVTLVSAHPALTSLTQSVTTLNLVDALKADGPFTVFAPTDDAFQVFVDGNNILPNLETFLTLTDLATEIITYHVTAQGKFMAADLAPAQFVKTISSDYAADVTKSDAAGVSVNNKATVTSADIKGTNGVIHVVDSVFQPATIAGLASAHPDFSVLVEALGAANLVGAVDDASASLTVFAPANDAFQAVIDDASNAIDSKDALLNLANLGDILSYHVVGSAAFAADLMDGQTLMTLLMGGDLTVAIDMAGVSINGAPVVAADVKAKNGVIHQIGSVLLPGN